MLKIYHLIDMKNLFYSITLLLFPILTHSQSFQWQANKPLDRKLNNKIEQWLDIGVTETERLFYRLPQKKIYFTVTPRNNAKEPVPWGQVRRDRYNSINLHIDSKASLSSLISDWTIYHEIAHLYHPFLENESTWLSEGFASYIQNVTMLHAGIYDKQTYINKLQAGFNRGIKNAQRNKGGIEKISKSMESSRSYMQVYWTGAAFFLEADHQLQAQNANLVEVISRYVACCLRTQTSGAKFIATLDKVSNTTIFTALHRRYITAQYFPQIQPSVIEHSANYYQLH
ncbi:hypothetical protein [Thalassotalea atypica]|uniref:M61 family metallopeptidase n=1 Tax=Thalassotalea atypica TaxID=2054316 RepID=UPI0025734BBD|nr:hypothetical protein [Thalassotalea atypica]